ncbi:MAG: nucleotide exchange factor GrpE [Clostridia bacterium]|nr:nucleotide exchange factor GrpE [Clostridia bacterium]
MNEEIRCEQEEEVKETEIPAQEKAEAPAEEPEKSKKEEKKSAKDKAKKQIEALENELAEQKDKYLRMMAEYDNFRRRAAKERESVYTDAYCDALEAVLPVMDNLELAARYSGGDAEKIAEGVNMVLNSFGAVFEKLGIEEIEAAPGVAFDPNLHNAVMHIEDESFGENEIAEVFTKGYKKGDKILRYTMVKVAN